MCSTHSRLSNETGNFLFDLDKQCNQSTAFHSNLFSDRLIDDSVVWSSSFGSPLSTSLSTSPPSYNALQQEFFEAPQYSGSTEDVSFYDDNFLTAYPHSYLQPPVRAANMWENSSNQPMITGEPFPSQAAANTTIDPSFFHWRESLPNDLFDSPPSPFIINSDNFSTSPTLAAAETITPPITSATHPESYPIGRRDAQADHTAFLSTSAPSPRSSQFYTCRVASDESTGDRDATIRRPKRSRQSQDGSRSAPDKLVKKAPSLPTQSLLKPPKLAPSEWQLYFADFTQKPQANAAKKLEIAQTAREAGPEYASLSSAEKGKYKRMSRAAKDTREEYSPYMRTLTPEDIKRENAFRTEQRKAGRSRKMNMKDPDAPKKPLSAYFMFLQHIRSDPELVNQVFGDEIKTTKQSVLAAAKWRSMTDDEREPFLVQAEQDKLDFELARKLHENSSITYESSIDSGTSPFVSHLGISSSLSPERKVLSLGSLSSSHARQESSSGEDEGLSS